MPVVGYVVPEHAAAEPLIVSTVHASLSAHVLGQLPSQVSGTSTTLLPHRAPKLSAKITSVFAQAPPPVIAATQQHARMIFRRWRQRMAAQVLHSHD